MPSLPRARTLLYVPASRPRMLAKAAQLPADLKVLDLEDGVAPAAKDEARGHLRRVLLSRPLHGDRSVWVRINPPGSPWHRDDLALVCETRPAGVLLAKAERVERVMETVRRIEGRAGAVGLMVETAAGVARVGDLAACHPSVRLLVYGSADLRLSLGARPDPERRWEMHALHKILLAARTAGCLAVDAVYFRFRDREGLIRDARVARNLGYDGKSCIHPSQIEPIREVFASSPEELAWARSVLRAWNEQEGDARGVVVMDGEMIEALHVEVARRILAREPGDVGAGEEKR